MEMGKHGMAYRLGVDVGGTFTDVQMQHTESGEITLVKVPSTPQDQSIGVLAGVREACSQVGITPKELDLILHGSTVVTNLILEAKAPRAACSPRGATSRSCTSHAPGRPARSTVGWG